MNCGDFTLSQLRFGARIRKIAGRSKLRRKSQLCSALIAHDAALRIQRAYRSIGPPVKNERDPITLEPLCGSAGRYFCYTTADKKSRIAYSAPTLAAYVEMQDDPLDPVTRERYSERDLDRLCAMSGRRPPLRSARQRRRAAAAEVAHDWSMGDVVVELARDLVRTVHRGGDGDVGLMFEFLVTQWAPSFHMCVETAALQDQESARECLRTAAAIFDEHRIWNHLTPLETQLLTSTVAMAQRSIGS